MRFGVDALLADRSRRSRLAGKRAALLGHAASVTCEGAHSLDALLACEDLKITAAFGPQHGMRGEKQDNMVESDDYLDPRHGIPVHSLYGDVRYPTDQMMATFDHLLVDIQDIGTRIYTYVTTLANLMCACAAHCKPVWILDRPNPAGRPVEGSTLEPGWESFVGAAPIPMRHGLTLGELALWFKSIKGLELELDVVAMADYDPEAAPGYGWPLDEHSWINPSPNAANLNMARCFPGTVLFEGTTLSEGRGTTRPLEVVGAPDVDFERILERMHALCPDWLNGCRLRPCYFEPVFHKHAGTLCSGIQLHTDNLDYDHQGFKPYRIACLMLKALRLEYPSYEIWRDFYYEYEQDRLAIDRLAGGSRLREWVDDPQAGVPDLAAWFDADERAWQDERAGFLIY